MDSKSKRWPGVEIWLHPDGTYAIERFKYIVPPEPIERVYESDGETDDALIARLEAEVERLRAIEQAARELQAVAIGERWQYAIPDVKWALDALRAALAEPAQSPTG